MKKIGVHLSLSIRIATDKLPNRFQGKGGVVFHLPSSFSFQRSRVTVTHSGFSYPLLSLKKSSILFIKIIIL